jgi:hypothetical protein
VAPRPAIIAVLLLTCLSCAQEQKAIVRLDGKKITAIEVGATVRRHRDLSTTPDDEFTFQVDSTGKVTGMVLHTGGKDIAIQRLP